jgi:hypothetical protein
MAKEAAIKRTTYAGLMDFLHCGPFGAHFDTKLSASPAPAQPAPGKALIYVVEDQKFKIAKEITVRVGVDGAWLGATRGSSYLFFSVEPGEHHLCVDWLSDWLPQGRLISFYGLTAESGGVHYFRARTMASPSNGYKGIETLDLDLVNADEGTYLVTSSPLSVSHPKK